MQFIDYLKRLKNIIIQSKISNDVIPKIENNKKVYRLHYLYFNGQPFEEMHDCACDTFAIPENFSENDAFKVISYFFNNTEYEIGTYYCCCATTEKIKSIGFKQIDNIQGGKYNIVDLFSIENTDDGRRFKKSEYYKHYFEWYCSGVTEKEVESIYEKNNMDSPFIKQNILQKKLNS